MRRRFFVERFEGAKAMLRGQSAAHLARALRAERDQLYELSDGERVWLARVERTRRDAVEFALVERVAAQEAPLRIQLLLSIVKFDRFEWCLEKATELGVSEIIPLAAARTGKALVAAAAKRARRWEKILLESAQQARRLRPPALSTAAKPGAAFAGPADQTKILLSESREAPPLREVLSKLALAVPWAQPATGRATLQSPGHAEARAPGGMTPESEAGDVPSGEVSSPGPGEERREPSPEWAQHAAPLQSPGRDTEMPLSGESQSHSGVWSFLAEGQGLDPYQERFKPRESGTPRKGLQEGANAGVPKPAAKDASRPPEGARRPAAKDAAGPEISAPEAVFRATSVALAIGPEGGWTEDELALARAAGFHEASLGGNILRTETAVIAALAILNYALGD